MNKKVAVTIRRTERITIPAPTIRLFTLEEKFRKLTRLTASSCASEFLYTLSEMQVAKTKYLSVHVGA